MINRRLNLNLVLKNRHKNTFTGYVNLTVTSMGQLNELRFEFQLRGKTSFNHTR